MLCGEVLFAPHSVSPLCGGAFSSPRRRKMFSPQHWAYHQFEENPSAPEHEYPGLKDILPEMVRKAHAADKAAPEAEPSWADEVGFDILLGDQASLDEAFRLAGEWAARKADKAGCTEGGVSSSGNGKDVAILIWPNIDPIFPWGSSISFMLPA